MTTPGPGADDRGDDREMWVLLEAQMERHATVNQAIGCLMARRGCDVDDALLILVEHCLHRHITIHEAATQALAGTV
ncbi:hypothetical protein Cpa01nite_01100 [Cellulomonas pakistanensis]|uniref:ANTAR domain-containing protein n=2 Tax=Cellulomonas pakistanensis TaxID=992287 RepID=A0A919P963_9CELL|nr:hypothetical protein Cpa01nite_01100 [Cellulomonas pakistanensis]